MTAGSVRHSVPSLLLGLDDEPWQPSQRLLELAGMLAMLAPATEHPLLSGRSGGGQHWFKLFPGEHYHLLTALCGLLKPASVWEFGTDTGMGTVALLEGLGPEAKIHTVDIDDWRLKRGPWLVQGDFDSGRVTQLVADMKSEALFASHLENLSHAELIFVDGPKDGVTEAAFLKLLDKVPFLRNPIIVFDDIRLMNMVHIWRGIQHPKMDMTSFGHWSGTGIVEWRPSPAPRPRLLPEAAEAAAPPQVVLRPVATVRPAERTRILLLCDQKPNYVPDLLLHGLRKLLGAAVVDHPRKEALYDGRLGQPYLDRIDGLMPPDIDIDRSDIPAKVSAGFFDLILCDVRAIDANRELLRDARGPMALIDGEDRPARLKPGNYVILRRETDGYDFSLPLPMAMPTELLDWIDRHADTPKTHGIGFLGSRSGLTPERNAILDELSRICPGALIGAWGVSEGKWQGRDAYYRALQGCKAVLSLPGAGLDTFRYWENAACNAAHIAGRNKLLIPDDFRDGHEIVRFSGIQELADAVERIESGTTDWRGMAEHSRHWLRAHHTTERRATATLDRLNAAFLR